MISREHSSQGKERPFVTIAGAEAYQRDLPNAELHVLDAGHFALEDRAPAIAAHIGWFLSKEAR